MRASIFAYMVKVYLDGWCSLTDLPEWAQEEMFA